MRLGIHCPVVDGFSAALERALSLRCLAMQMLPYRRHHDPAQEDVDGFSRRRKRGGIQALLVHSRFVPSLASSDPGRRRRSIALLASELDLAARWQADGFVLHAGAYSPEGSSSEGLRLAAQSMIEAALAGPGERIPLIIENVPGGGRRLGGTLEELAELLEIASRRLKKVAVCLDTAHAWAAGYDVSSAEGMLKFLARAHRLFGAVHVAAFHLNDTRALFGSHREHHEHWGKGRLGLEGAKVLLGHREYDRAVGILETPPDGAQAEDLSTLRGLT